MYVNRPKMRAQHSGSIPKAWGHKIKTAEPIQQKKGGLRILDVRTSDFWTLSRFFLFDGEDREEDGDRIDM